MPGARAEPAALRAKVKSTQASHHRSAERSGIPCAMVVPVSFVLAPETGLVVSVSSAQCASIVADGISASGYQAHTTSPSASRTLVLSATLVHRIPRPTSVTIAKRPS
jgi:hypothetical protein